MRIGICTSGGDCPGLNAAIYAVVKSSLTQDPSKIEILPLRNGYDALLEKKALLPLSFSQVADILPLGGTILGAANGGSPFHNPKLKDDAIKRMIEGAKFHKLDVIIVVGGEGSQGMAKHLLGHGIRFVGIGKTIDNDMIGNDVTIGFKTAVDTACKAVDNLICTAKSHSRPILVEVMGRDSGFLALETAIISGADMVLIPEIKPTFELFKKMVLQTLKSKNYFMGIISEGAHLKGDSPVFNSKGSASKKLGGICEQLSDRFWQETKIEIRSVKLGHLLRGGSPTSEDRLLAQQLGVLALETAINPSSKDVVILFENGKFVKKPFESLDFKNKRIVSFQNPQFLLAEKLGIIPMAMG